MTNRQTAFLIVLYGVLIILCLTTNTGCASLQSSNISECRLLCQGQKVDEYRDELSVCKCRSPETRESE